MTTKIKESNNQPSSDCLFNIIFYVESQEMAQQHQQFLDNLKKKFPCRGIFLIEDKKLEQQEPKIFLNGIEKSDAKPKNPCDQITVQFNLKTRERIPFLILTYLASDLPTYVIWAQDPNIKNPILFNLKEIATKIVFNPTNCLHLKEFSRQLLTQMESKKCSISDFSWFSITGWRNLISSIFSSPELVDHLFHSRLIRIKYNRSQEGSNERNEIPAIYLQAWIAAALNWKIHDVEPIEGNVRISYERFIHDTVVLIIPEVVPGLAPGAITSVEIDAAGKYKYLLKRSGADPTVKVWISSQDLCEIPFHHLLTEPNKEQFVVSELFWRGTSKSYEDTLRLIYQINWND